MVAHLYYYNQNVHSSRLVLCKPEHWLTWADHSSLLTWGDHPPCSPGLTLSLRSPGLTSSPCSPGLTTPPSSPGLMVLPCLPGLITHPCLFLSFASVGLRHGAVVALRKNKAPFSFLIWYYFENGILVSSSQPVPQAIGLEKQEFRIRHSFDEPEMWSDDGRSEFRVECDKLK